VLLVPPMDSGRLSAQQPAAVDAYLSLVGEHFRMPPEELRMLLQAGAEAEELPVLLRLSRTSGISPTVLLTLRRRGDSWLAIAHRYQLGAATFHVAIPDAEVDDRIRRAQQLFRETPESRWNTIQLDNQELVTLANLQVLVRKTGHSPGRILEARNRAGSFPGAVPLLAGRP